MILNLRGIGEFVLNQWNHPIILAEISFSISLSLLLPPIAVYNPKKLLNLRILHKCNITKL